MGGAVKSIGKAISSVVLGSPSKKSSPAPAPASSGGGGGGGDNGAAAIAAERAKLEAERKAFDQETMTNTRISAEQDAGKRKARAGRSRVYRPLLARVRQQETLGSEQKL